jgi:hypothetical protein
MDAVAHTALRAIFKFHAKDVTWEIVFEDVGMLPPSLTMHLSKLAWLKRIHQLSEE